MGIRHFSFHKFLLAGIIASIIFILVMMIYEGTNGTGFWSPTIFISATVFRTMQNAQTPISFQLFPVILGAVVNSLISLTFSAIFHRFINRKIETLPKAILGWVLYGIIIFIVMWFVVLPIVDPVMLKLNGFVFALAHIAWGISLALLLKKL